MSERHYETIHDIAIEVYPTSDPWAELTVYRFDDGTPRHTLSASDLRELASMCEEMADRLEELDDE